MRYFSISAKCHLILFDVCLFCHFCNVQLSVGHVWTLRNIPLIGAWSILTKNLLLLFIYFNMNTLTNKIFDIEPLSLGIKELCPRYARNVTFYGLKHIVKIVKDRFLVDQFIGSYFDDKHSLISAPRMWWFAAFLRHYKGKLNMVFGQLVEFEDAALLSEKIITGNFIDFNS